MYHHTISPQVTQAILEFEEGNQGIIDRLSSGDLGGQLGDGSIGQLGHPDNDGQGHGHGMLPGKFPAILFPCILACSLK